MSREIGVYCARHGPGKFFLGVGIATPAQSRGSRSAISSWVYQPQQGQERMQRMIKEDFLHVVGEVTHVKMAGLCLVL